MLRRPEWARRGAAPALLVVAVAACLLFRRAPLLNAALVGVGGLVASRWLARRHGGPFLERVVTAAYATVVVLAVALWAISAWQLPILSRLQLGGGFWAFAWDAYSYDALARDMVRAWIDGTEFPQRDFADYFILTAFVYLVLGSHPLTAILLNAPLHAVSVVAAFRLGGQIGSPLGARTAAILTAFWPSLLLWSAQLLRDPLTVAFLMTLLSVAAAVLTGDSAPSARRPRGLRWVFVLAMMVVLYRMRPYLTLLLVASIAAVAVFPLVRPSTSTRRRRSVAALLAVSVVAVALGAQLDILRLVSPTHPERGHIRLGLARQREGDNERALEAYQRALRLNPSESIALHNAGLAALALGRASQAREHLETFLRLRPTAGEGPLREVVAQLSSGRSDAAGALAHAIRPLELDGGGPTGPDRARPANGGERGLKRLWDGISHPVERIDDLRQRSLVQGGAQVAPEVRFRSPLDVMAFLPRGLAIVFFSPSPSQWLGAEGGTGVFKRIAVVEALLMYALALPLLIGSGFALTSRRPDRILLVLFVALSAVGMALTVVNLGTLFRLRLSSLVPAMALAGLGCQWLRDRWPFTAGGTHATPATPRT